MASWSWAHETEIIDRVDTRLGGSFAPVFGARQLVDAPNEEQIRAQPNQLCAPTNVDLVPRRVT